MEHSDMTILQIDKAYFRLPDGFDGTVEDAVVLFAEYFASHKGNTKQYKDGNDWDRFIDLWPHDESKFCGAIGVLDLNGDHTEFVCRQ